jgi:hypothetical protein
MYAFARSPAVRRVAVTPAPSAGGLAGEISGAIDFIFLFWSILFYFFEK